MEIDKTEENDELQSKRRVQLVNYEKYSLVRAKFTPKNQVAVHPDQRKHIGKTITFMAVWHEISADTYEQVQMFTPHECGYEEIGLVPSTHLSDIRRMDF